MRPEDIDFMIKLLQKRSGLALTPDKEYLLESRLTPIARAHACGDLSALVNKLRHNPPASLLTEVTEAMMTHESSFFRDGKPYDYLRKALLPQLRANAGGGRTLRIWSAACSTGQEPYSIAITLLEDAAQNPGWTYEILATDLVGKAIEKAGQGVYSQFEAQRGMPIQMLLKYFKQTPDTGWQAGDALRSMVKFQPFNLLTDTAMGRFDIIFCRNVLIYFDAATKSMVIERLCNVLKPGGYLILGSTESLTEQERRHAQADGACAGVYRRLGSDARQLPKHSTELRSKLS